MGIQIVVYIVKHTHTHTNIYIYLPTKSGNKQRKMTTQNPENKRSSKEKTQGNPQDGSKSKMAALWRLNNKQFRTSRTQSSGRDRAKRKLELTDALTSFNI